jgi:hypothetical protein
VAGSVAKSDRYRDRWRVTWQVLRFGDVADDNFSAVVAILAVN